MARYGPGWTTRYSPTTHPSFALAWGDNPEGQLGNGTKINESVPIRVGTDTNWLAAAGGDYHTLAIRTDGSLWAWGLNDHGQLGDGTQVNRLKPIQVGHDNEWVAVAAGER